MQIVITGIGGQGILFTSRILGHIALSRNEDIIGNEVHGMAQRGGSVVSHIKMGSFSSPLVMPGEADLLLAFDQYEAIRNLHFLKDGGQLLQIGLPVDGPVFRRAGRVRVAGRRIEQSVPESIDDAAPKHDG